MPLPPPPCPRLPPPCPLPPPPVPAPPLAPRPAVGLDCQWAVAGSGAWQRQHRRRPTAPPAPAARA
ncbi:hypothetical protein DMT42_09400 [Streptomyces actuosus]|uniref:Uncharacterized protein n=1 Tax=Streptomyces actuosus TaxID=1885 RepID=A0A2U9NYU3_STRAS|nr:hypothetical protein DMT42_09400 [Streptomyces actuosus]